ncbi:MAG: hypothetical protein KDB00_30155, partial [Planctomycetales bacterium]|nr:hypothetical protein [Planctomycetales bacterium]
VGHMAGLDFARTMEFAATISDVTDLTSVLFIKCFVPGTPVWVPVEGAGDLFAAGYQGGPLIETATNQASMTQLAAGVSVAILTAVSFSALMAPVKRDDEEADEHDKLRWRSVDTVFGGRDASWQDLADVLWSDPHAAEYHCGDSPHRFRKIGFS